MTTLRKMKWAEVKSSKSLIVIRGKVVDLKAFFKDHPGGVDVLEAEVGGDATESFDNIGHSARAKGMMKQFQVGVLDEPGVVVAEEDLREQWEVDAAKDKAKKGGGGIFSWWKMVIPAALAIAALAFMKQR